MDDRRTQDKLLDLVERGRTAGAVGQLFEEALAEAEAAVDRRIFGLLMTGAPISPEGAIQAWYEKYAYRRLRGILSQQKAAGVSAARRLSPGMELTVGAASSPSAENGGYNGD